MIIGYARVSSEEQILDRQIDILNDYGCDEIYQEKTSTRKERDTLNSVLQHIRKGDTIVVDEVSRLGRSTPELVINANRLDLMGVNLICIKEKIDTTTFEGKIFFYFSSIFAELERKRISDRTKDGLMAAKKRGTKLGRRFTHNIEEFKRLVKAETSPQETMNVLSMSKSNYYRLLNKLNKGEL